MQWQGLYIRDSPTKHKNNNKNNRRKPKKRKKHFADYIVFIAIVAVTGYTVAAFVLQFLGKFEISATLTTCWYAFWTTEIVALATIKNAKTKSEKIKKEDEINERYQDVTP